MLPTKSPASTSRATRRARCRAAACTRTLCVPMAVFVTRAVGQAGRSANRHSVHSRSGPALAGCAAPFRRTFRVSGACRQHVARQRQVEWSCIALPASSSSPCIGHGGVTPGTVVHGSRIRDQSHHERIRVWMCAIIVTAWNEFSARGVAAACLSGWQCVTVCDSVCRCRRGSMLKSGRIICLIRPSTRFLARLASIRRNRCVSWSL